MPCCDNMVASLQEAAASSDDEKKAVDIEKVFSQLTLDIIGLALFNYEFGALTKVRCTTEANFLVSNC